MSSILPKGIVVNTPEISGDIQKIDREPLALEEIAKFWKVYTTTKRRLVDPTAERLENFWWRIWGSPKRNLRGATVARIFADISDEISFVPLRGPRNRDESGGRMVTSLTRGVGTASTAAIHGRQGSDSSYGRESSSLSKYAATMPPPILKKSRGPSGNGPRPIARFISPETSEEDIAEASFSAGLDAKVVIRPPTPPPPAPRELKKVEALAGPRKKGQGSVVMTGSHRRRPGVPRRPNSDPATRTGENTSKSEKGHCQSLPENANHEGGSVVSPSQSDIDEHALPSSESLLSAKGSGKTQPEKSVRARGIHRQGATQKRDPRQTSIMKLALNTGSGEGEDRNSIQPARREEDCSLKVNCAEQVTQSKYQEGLAPHGRMEPQLAVRSQPSPPTESLDTTVHSDKPIQSQLTSRRHLNTTDGENSISVLYAYRTTTQETLHQNGPHLEAAPIQGASALGGEEKLSAGDLEQAALFAKRPIQPAKSASALFSGRTHESNGSISRTKSQLTLLLERDRQN